jgi:ribose/xylose/arabinose/galactoside ABC-type transport system permease subunit
MIKNVLSPLGVSLYWRAFTSGAVLLMAVLFDPHNATAAAGAPAVGEPCT